MSAFQIFFSVALTLMVVGIAYMVYSMWRNW